MGMRAPEVTAPCISVSIELNKTYRAKLFVNGSQDRQQDGMISANADRPCRVTKHFSELLSDSLVGIFNRQWINGEVTKIGDAPFFKWINFQHRIPRPDHGRLNPYISRTKTRARTISCAAIERYPDESDVQFLGLRDMRQPHECGNTGKTRVHQRVHRLRMRLCALLGFHRVARIIKHPTQPHCLRSFAARISMTCYVLTFFHTQARPLCPDTNIARSDQRRQQRKHS